MKIAVTSTSKDVHSELDTRFGRCANFLVIDTEGNEPEVVDNSKIASGSGAGIAAAQMLIDRKVDVVITGNVGPNAFQTLEAAGVEIYSNMNGRILDLIDLFIRGELKRSASPNVQGHHGLR
jgi:predicted Fe-Mo cluster-binding NifX family protein